MFVSSARQSFSNPVIPFAGTILGGLVPGEMILIQGSVPAGAERFQVDLTCGSSAAPRADVAFHLNPRFGRSPRFVCNALQGQRWGSEEIHHGSPLSHGHAFELVIVVQRDGYKVAVNGAHLLEFKHRVALQRVDTIAISGQVSIQAVGVASAESVTSAISATPTNQEPEKSMMSSGDAVVVMSSGDTKTPFAGEIKGGLRAGLNISIRARTNQNAQSFCVNLRCSGSGDIALHLNPRLKRRTFVRNSFLSQCWGPEETALAGFPFSAGQYFEMIVRCEPHNFKVAVNGLHLLEFKHRVQDLTRVQLLEVEGDVTLVEVKIF